MNNTFYALSILFCAFLSCQSGGPDPDLPALSIKDSQVKEQDGGAQMIFDLSLDAATEEDITITYQFIGITAEPDVDFVAANGTVSIKAGSSNTQLTVDVLEDAYNEVDEKFSILLVSADLAVFEDSTAIGVIWDDDEPLPTETSGYITPEAYYGYDLAWQDEFSGTELTLDDYSYDLGDGCPDICGWGNNEKQWYTDDPKNIRVEDGKMIITATKEGSPDYKSGKVHTKGKQEFNFGRIDIRAKLPRGQGIWPAIWMLGKNIDEVGWPACGEIDIMEMVGHQPKTVHGTAHWGPQGRGFSTYSTSTYFIDEDFAEEFHVFSLVWEYNEMVWYVDETKFKTLTSKDMQGETYRFNQSFYFIFNIAVGGNWPGEPDGTTVFPQTMEIDYVRVFQ